MAGVPLTPSVDGAPAARPAPANDSGKTVGAVRGHHSSVAADNDRSAVEHISLVARQAAGKLTATEEVDRGPVLLDSQTEVQRERKGVHVDGALESRSWV